MLCWIIYNKEDVEKNKRFIEKVSDGLKEYGIDTEVIILQEVKDIEKFIEKKKPDIAVNRSRNSNVAYMLEDKGIIVYNSAKVTEIANDKEKTYQYLKGIVPYMAFESDVEKIRNFPYIIKSVDGHGGNEVFLIENEKDRVDAIEKIKNKKMIAQECASDLGKDVRVYIIGNQIVAAMLRKSEKSFKSNYSLGGSVEAYELNAQEQQMVKNILEVLPLDYGGIDFIFHKGKAVFNEIEDAAGARMIYENTNIDILHMYAEYISKGRCVNR